MLARCTEVCLDIDSAASYFGMSLNTGAIQELIGVFICSPLLNRPFLQQKTLLPLSSLQRLNRKCRADAFCYARNSFAIYRLYLYRLMRKGRSSFGNSEGPSSS